MEKVCVVGLGYIGLPTASLLATKGFEVHGVDVNPKTVNTINQGKIHIHEPDLDILVKAAVQSGNLRAAIEPCEADIFIIAVPTPFTENHAPDLSYVKSATEAISGYIRPGNLIILESTSPVGTTEKIAKWLQEQRDDLKMPIWNPSVHFHDMRENDVYIAHCPERVLPGQILRELVENDRIIGGVNRLSAERAGAFYLQFVKGQVFFTDSRTAELSKLTENAFRDVNIAFANELSLICDKLGISVWELIHLANKHPRVNILQPGPGVGGHCIAVDPWFIVNSAPEEAKLIRTAREVNDYKPHYVVSKIKERADRFRAPIITCLGLAFKPDIGDLRESPSVEIVKKLANLEVGSILVVEPHITELPYELKEYPNIKLTDYASALQKADVIVLLVNHKVFNDINQDILKEKVVIDTRGVWR